MKTIFDYPEKEILVADLIRISSGKDRWMIFDTTTDDIKVYEGRVEDLEWTKDGAAHELCERIVKYIDESNDGFLLVYIK